MKFNINSPIKDKQNLLLAAFRQIMRPLIRLLLTHGITYTLLLEELKRLYVEIAETEFKVANIKQTDSRINVLTGVHRKDVHRLRNEVTEVDLPKTNLSAQLIAHWIGSPDFIDAAGNPKVIPRASKNGDEVSFDALVASVSKDIRAKPVFEEWLRLGILEQVDQQMLRLNTQAFIPEDSLEDQIFFLAMNLHDHLATAVHNIQSDAPKMLERCVYQEGLTLEQVTELQAFVRDKVVELLHESNQKAINMQVSAQSTSEQKYRMNTGMYYFYEPDQESVSIDSVADKN